MSDRSRKARIVRKATPVSETAVASEIAEALHRVADTFELVAGGLFAIAAGANTDAPDKQRNMAAVFQADSLSRYGDVWKKLDEKQRRELERFIDGICKGKK